MSKPIDLIVANELHRIAEAIEKMPPVLRAGTTAADFKTEVARQVLCKISHEASVAAVVRALEAVGVCGGVDGLAQRLAAVQESRAEERRAAGEPEPTPQIPVNFERIVDSLAKTLQASLGDGVIVKPVKVEG
jgi:hypothetical protein